MTSREIAELTGKQHKNVLRDIDTLLLTLGSELSFGFKSSTYLAGNPPREYRQFDLDRDSTYCLVAGYDATARMKIIKRWQELEAREAAPQIPQFSPDPIVNAIMASLHEIGTLKTKLSNLSHATETIRDVTKKVAEHFNQRLTKLESLAVTGVTDPAPITRGNPKRPFLYRKGMMTRTEVGKHFGLSAQRISDILIELGLQIDATPKWAKRHVYELTPLGRAYGAPIHTNGALIAKSSTATGAQRARTILWLPEVLSVIAEHLEAEA